MIMLKAKELQISKNKQIELDRDLMAKGYLEMAAINLGIAGEDLHLETEAENTINQFNAN